MSMPQDRLVTAANDLKGIMAALAQDYYYPALPGYEEEVNAAYQLLDRAKHQLHDIIDKMSLQQGKSNDN